MHHCKLDMNTTNSAGHVLNFRIELNGFSRNKSTPVQSDHSSYWSRLTTQTAQELILFVVGFTLFQKDNLKIMYRQLIS